MTQKTRATITAEVTALINDNAVGDITPAELRGVLLDINDSAQNILTDGTGGGTGIENIVEDTTPQLGGSLDVNGNSIVSVSNGNIAITPNGTGKIILDGLSWPITDGTVNQVLRTDGAGQLSFVAQSGGGGGLTDVVLDTTPQLGGALDVNGNSIVSVSNGNIAITPNGTGRIILDGLNWPTSDGVNNYVLKTNGAGQLSWAAATSGSTNADAIFQNIFIASNTLGTADVHDELRAAIIAAAGETLYIPEGRYLIHSDVTGLAAGTDVNIVASPRAIFLNEYRTDNEARCIWQRNEGSAGPDTAILAIDNVIYFRTELTTRIRVADASQFAVNDIIHVHSQNGMLNSSLTEAGSEIRRIGQSGKIAEIDLKNNYIYLYGSLEYAPYMLTSPKIRKYPTTKFYWEGGVFQGKVPADVLNPVLNDQGFRRPAMEISGTANVHIKNVTFDTVYNQSIQLTSCPYSIVEGCRFKGTPNMRLPTEGTPVCTITGINRPAVVTQAGTTTINSKVITMATTTGMIVGMEVSGTGIVGNAYITDVSAGVSITITDNCTASGAITVTGYPAMEVTTNVVTGLASGNFVMFSGVGGMTQLNNKFYTLAGAPSGTTFTLIDYFGRAALNASGNVVYQTLSGRIFDAWTSGGIVQETSGGDTLTAYGVQLYAASCFSVVRDCHFQFLRHAVTSDGRGGNTYSAAQWFNYGHPCKVSVLNCVSFDAHGIPFDTHEEGINWQFINCHAVISNRGPYFQSSYDGTGFQDRATNTLYKNCTATGGTRGIRISKSDNIIPSTTRIMECTVTNNKTAEDETGIGLYIATEVAGGTRPTRVVINGLTIIGCGTGIEALSSGSNSTVGTALDITATGLMFFGTKVGMDIGAGVHFKATTQVGFDITASEYTGDHFVSRNRSQANATLTGGTKTSGSAVITGLTGATSYFPGHFVSGLGVPPLARIKSVDSASQITLDVPCFATGVSDIVIWRNSSCLLLGGVNVVQNHERVLRAIFGESDSNSTKYTYVPPNGVTIASVGTKLRTFANTDITAEIITVPAHTFIDMEAVRVKLLTGVLPTGVAENTTYFVNNLTSTTLSLHTTMAGARLNTGRVPAASAGAGTYTIQAIPNMQWRSTSLEPTTIGTYPEIFQYS
jgi:hypothetical protein